MPNLIKPERLSLLNHPAIKEAWIQEQIANDPSILGLGDLIMKDKERIQPRAGRLDLLLQDAETKRRFEVEVQLGKTDEAHIIRTIEYWDIERKRYPQYDHCAVIIAEDITSRFLNVISLFNGTIPLIAIQLNALKFGDDIALVFTKVLDELPLGMVEEDEEVSEVTDREYWIKRGSPETVKMADSCLEIIQKIETGIELKYNKFYIGLAKDGQAYNFCIFTPRKKDLNIVLKLPASDEIQKIIDEAAFDDMGFDARWGNYRLRISKEDLKTKMETLHFLMQKALVYYRS
jgi:predicted transport protein